MTEFNNVSVQKEANIYFKGKVVSTLISFPNGSKKTLGVMQIGEYEFNTEQKEIMEIMINNIKEKYNIDIITNGGTTASDNISTNNTDDISRSYE